MKFVLASYGTRGDVEPFAALGRELTGRGHEVRMAVAPDLVDFVESAGLSAVGCGPDTRVWQDVHHEFLTHLPPNSWKIRHLIKLGHEDRKLFRQCEEEIGATLMSLADGADMLVTFVLGEHGAGNVADYYNIPLAELHTFPVRAHGNHVPLLPTPLARSVMKLDGWLNWRLLTAKLQNQQRHEWGLPKATSPVSLRLAERGGLEIQAYHDLCFPEIAAEWAEFDGQRPFVGALTLQLPTKFDEEVASWVAAGTPPIYCGFGSNLIQSPADTLAMVSAACAQLGERALVCSGWSDFRHVAHMEHVKVVEAVNHAAVFPACRAVVHHGGAGTLAAALRAGVPQLVLATWPAHQTLWGPAVERLMVGTARRLSSTTENSLVADLRTILAPEYAVRAREIAARVTKPAESVANAADHLEIFARREGVGR
ncbi:glycosyltransferase [Mycobacterium sp. 1164985.4]|uniref:glycosyltransferase n=1 Tax=Mycobacterium sp. 1164985.4 TaxID=1834069 RepID=UPI0007FCAEAD|nr:glycosyltransferase [Mycobacterium sp. 1164985.4]OBK73780.1 glycosyl transferase family 1 [Mycobacterium sp. 1164985.4]